MRPYSKSIIGNARIWLEDDRESALEGDPDAGIIRMDELGDLFAELRDDLEHWNNGSVVDWIPCERGVEGRRLPMPHQDVLALNRDGRIFRSRMCYGLHEPFFTYPHGYANPSDTVPKWIDVTHWAPLPKLPEGHR